MIIRVNGKVEKGSEITGCSCRNGEIDLFEGSIRKNNLVIFCVCEKRYVSTQTGALIESSGITPCPKEKIPDAEVTP